MEQEQFSELKSKLDALKERVSSQYEAQSARTTPPPSEWNEKQTENYIIEPFMRDLGFNLQDPNNPEAAIPEFDRGVRSSATRVDYALLLNSQPVMLVECKQLGEPLDKHVNQLDEYFRAPGGQINTVKIGILSNGDEFRFYTDSKDPNVMDPEPYWMFKLSKLSDGDVETLLHYTVKNLKNTLDDLPATVYASRLKRWLIERDEEELAWLYKATAKEIKTGGRSGGEDMKNAKKIWTLIFPATKIKENLNPPEVEQKNSETETKDEELEQEISLADCPSDISSLSLKISGYSFAGSGIEDVKSWSDMMVEVIAALCKKYDLPSHLEISRESAWLRHTWDRPSGEDSGHQKWVKVTDDCEIKVSIDNNRKISALKKCFEAVRISPSELIFFLR